MYSCFKHATTNYFKLLRTNWRSHCTFPSLVLKTYSHDFALLNLQNKKRPHRQNSSVIANWMIIYAKFEVNVRMNLLLWFLLSKVLLAVSLCIICTREIATTEAQHTNLQVVNVSKKSFYCESTKFSLKLLIWQIPDKYRLYFLGS